MSRCIQHLVGKELVQNYQRDKKRPGEDCKDELERRPGGRGKKLNHANNQRKIGEHKT